MKTLIITTGILLGLVCSSRWYVVADPSTTVDGTGGATLVVNCNAGTSMTLGYALQAATPGSTILVSGICQESVTITTDGLTIDGEDQGATTIDGGGATAIAIDGARRLTLMNMTVQNGFRGIHASNGASLLVDNVTSQNNTREGIRLDRNSTATFRGAITSHNNGDDGIIILENSSGVFDAATVQLNNNQGTITGTNGINVTIASSAVFDGGTLEANGNTHHGIAVRRAASIYFSGIANLTTNDNGTHGINIHGGSDFYMIQSPQWHAANNGGIGMKVSENSNVTITTDPAVTLDSNGGGGLFVGGASEYRSSGMLTIQNSGGDGILVTNQSDLDIAGSTTSITNSGANGIFVQDAHVAARNLTVTNSVFNGVTVVDNGVFSLGGSNTLISGNGVYGVAAFRSSTMFLSATVQILNHASDAGLRVAQDSQVDATDLDIQNNFRGISVDESTITLTDVTLLNNVTNDLIATFGARLTLNGNNTIGTIFCEASVLSRGSPMCP